MTDKQKNLVCSIKLSLVKAIINLDEQKMWDLIKQAMKEEKNYAVGELNVVNVTQNINTAVKCGITLSSARTVVLTMLR